jgi:RimJ/RimL family protein N-acetyltransferase
MPVSPPIVIRPLCAADQEALRTAFARLGDESRYRRFLTAVSTLTPAQLRYLTDVDQRDHVALAAVEDGYGIVGVARFIRLEAHEAELAIAVVDAHQGQGLGGDLLAALAKRARDQGVTRFHATVLADNARMLRLLSRLGEVRCQTEGAALHVTVDLFPSQGPCHDGDER